MNTGTEYIQYIKDGVIILLDPSDNFIYETSVYVHCKGYFSLCNKKYYSSIKELEGVVGIFNKTPYIQICSELFAAPEKWLIANGYIRYVEPKKIHKSKLKTK